jgi:CBS domain-containing protein
MGEDGHGKPQGGANEMASTVEELMTRNPSTVEIGDSLVDAARAMHEGNIGNVIVTDGGRVAGIITDRDIVVRAIAEGRDPQSTTVGEVCSSSPRTLGPEESVEVAAQVMGDNGIRRLPVVRDGELVGVLSLGDLAQDRDAGPPLAEISAATPNN